MATTSRDAPMRMLHHTLFAGTSTMSAVALIVGLLVFTGLGAGRAGAVEGSAPASQTKTVLSKVHTDAVSTFLDGGTFSLGTKADTPDSGTPYDPATVWFHVDGASKQTLPTGFDFIGPAGSEAWVAPESNPGGQQLWPGFSTEGVPAGAISTNTTTFTLTDVRGPEGGTVEVYTGGGATQITRRWSSDEDHKTFTLPRTHSHASWAFTRAGTYELDVQATVTLGGSPVSDTATYTFVVGDLPETIQTATTISAAESSVTAGTPVTLTAAVGPGTTDPIEGAVEFRNGATVLGHTPIDAAGNAELIVPNLPVGTHSLTAVFVPSVTNLATTSTSATPATVTVTDAAGAQFSVTGVEESYAPGETMQARIAGATLEEGQEIQWRMRPSGTTYTGTVLSQFVPETDNPDARAGRLDLVMHASYDGYELQAALVQDGVAVSATAWTGPISVPDAVEPLSLAYEGPTPFVPGDVATMPVGGRPLGDGESLRVVQQPALGHFNLWSPVGSGFQAIDERAFAFEPPGTSLAPLGLQVVKDGIVVAQSEPLVVEISRSEFFLEGMQSLYRAGQTFDATMTVTPDLGDRVEYSWAMYENYQDPLQVGSGEAGRTFEMPVTADMDGKRMFIQANVVYPSGNKTLLGGSYPYLTVSDQEGQLFQFSSLSDHYHQGAAVNLQLNADPGLVEGDTIVWEWRWPGADWEPLPGAEGLDHQLTAEQALDGLEVRATLSFADEGTEPLVAGPVVIAVDDHGIPAVQAPTVAGDLAYTAGDALALSLQLSEGGSTVLAGRRWERKAAGAQEWTVLEGQVGDELTPVVTVADDGAQYRVSILKPTGEVAYGPSPAVTISVDEPAGRQFSITPLEEVYQSGDLITAVAVGEPALTSQDGVQWHWSFPGSDEWTYMPSCCGTGQELVAEQGLDGAQLRATLYSGNDVQVSEPVTIHVDDEGAPAAHVPSVSGATAFVAGETLALSRLLPDGVATILPDHRWERRAAGSDEWTTLETQGGDELVLAATLADDDASYRVSIVTPAGEVAYGPSEPVTVSVAEETTTEFGLAGVQESYAIGDVLRARVVGRDRAEGQTWRYFIRPVGSTASGSTFYGDGYSHGDTDSAAWAAGRVRQTLGADLDGYEIRARLRDGGAYVAETAWVPIDVDVVEAPATMTFPEGPFYGADDIDVAFTGDLAEGDTMRLVQRQTGSLWSEPHFQSQSEGVVRYMDPYPSGAPTEFALTVVRDGVAVSISEPVTRTITPRETFVQGVQGVYRVGQTLSATAAVFPELEGVTYSWYLTDGNYTSTLLKQGTGEDALSVEVPMLAEHDGGYLQFEATFEHPEFGTIYPAYWSTELRVSTAAPGEQLLFFKSLSGHYHQGYDVNLEVVADPLLGAEDTVTWEWKWPGGDWIPFPGPSGSTHHMVAEQALDNVEVRATVDFADEGKESMSTEVTIHHDDHGGVARQQPAVVGDLEYIEGDPLALALQLPDNGATVLTERRWERKAAGSEEWTVVEGQSGDALTAVATAADDGAQYRVAIVKPTGEVAYGPSPAVTVGVDEVPDVAPSITTQPASVSVEVGSSTALTVVAGGTDLTYRWQKRIGSFWFPIPDEGGAELRFEAARPADAGEYRVVVSNSLGTVSSSAATVAVTDPVEFTDVTGTVFAPEIAWLARSGVTTGYPDGTFRPSESVLREQMAAFLYRFELDGANPETDAPKADFSDVPGAHPFSSHIAWLADSGVTTGYSDGTFRPSAPVLREQMAAFLYRMAGRPPVVLPEESPFADVAESHAFYTEMVWLESTGITTGYTEVDGSVTFRGSQPVLREQMAAFLSRYHDLEQAQG